jgi:hypothetical protein
MHFAIVIFLLNLDFLFRSWMLCSLKGAGFGAHSNPATSPRVGSPQGSPFQTRRTRSGVERSALFMAAFGGTQPLRPHYMGPPHRKLPAKTRRLRALSYRRRPPLKRENQVFRVQLKLLQANFLKLFVFAEIGLLKQLFQPLSVATVFGLQAIDLFAQRRILYFVHQAPPIVKYIASDAQLASRKITESNLIL